MYHSFNIEFLSLFKHSLFFCNQNLVNTTKFILVSLESNSEKVQAHCEKFVIIILVEDSSSSNVADEIFEEWTNHNVDDLSYQEIHSLNEFGWILLLLGKVESSEIFATGDILFCSGLIELIQGHQSKVLWRDCTSEIEGDIIHEEAF